MVEKHTKLGMVRQVLRWETQDSEPNVLSKHRGMHEGKYVFLGVCRGFLMPCTIFAPLFFSPSLSQLRSGVTKQALPLPLHYGSCLACLPPEDFSLFFPRRLAPY